MTTAQPGQEQRMAVYEAAAALIADVRARYPGEELRCPHMRALDETVAARPTAGLGEDGELIDWLQRATADERERQAADRLILYREALADIASVDEAFVRANGTYAAFDKIVARASALLSRSGDKP